MWATRERSFRKGVRSIDTSVEYPGAWEIELHDDTVVILHLIIN